jgi:hypothetical protein
LLGAGFVDILARVPVVILLLSDGDYLAGGKLEVVLVRGRVLEESLDLEGSSHVLAVLPALAAARRAGEQTGGFGGAMAGGSAVAVVGGSCKKVRVRG